MEFHRADYSTVGKTLPRACAALVLNEAALPLKATPPLLALSDAPPKARAEAAAGFRVFSESVGHLLPDEGAAHASAPSFSDWGVFGVVAALGQVGLEIEWTETRSTGIWQQGELVGVTGVHVHFSRAAKKLFDPLTASRAIGLSAAFPESQALDPATTETYWQLLQDGEFFRALARYPTGGDESLRVVAKGGMALF